MPSVFPHLIEILPRLMHDNPRQRDEGDEVRDRHESVDDVGEYPDRLQFQEGTARDEGDEDKAVGQDGTHPPR